MTTPERIRVWVDYDGNWDGTWLADSETLQPHRLPDGEYIRRCPAVLAVLPEVKALVAAETERCAKIAEHFRDMCGECHWPEDAVIAGGNVANDIAAAIREGRA